MAEYYVDYLNGNDTTGDGLSDGTAWKTIQKALDTITKASPGLDRINVKSSAAQVLAASLDFTTIEASIVSTSPLVIQGYDSTAGDGGEAEIDMNGSSTYQIGSSTLDFTHFVDLYIHNRTGSGSCMIVDESCSIMRCRIGDTAFSQLSTAASSNAVVWDCEFNDIGATNGPSYNAQMYLANMYRACANTDPVNEIQSLFFHNARTSNAFHRSSDGPVHIFNTAFSTLGTQIAFSSNSTVLENAVFINNYAEGFNGGFTSNTTLNEKLTRNSKAYNNTTNFAGAWSTAGTFTMQEGDEALGASGYSDPTNDNFKPNASIISGWPETLPGTSLSTYFPAGAIAGSGAKTEYPVWLP